MIICFSLISINQLVLKKCPFLCYHTSLVGPKHEACFCFCMIDFFLPLLKLSSEEISVTCPQPKVCFLKNQKFSYELVLNNFFICNLPSMAFVTYVYFLLDFLFIPLSTGMQAALTIVTVSGCIYLAYFFFPGTCRTSFHPICAREASPRMEMWGGIWQ